MLSLKTVFVIITVSHGVQNVYSFVPNASRVSIIPNRQTRIVAKTATARDAINWFKTKDLEYLLPKQDALKIIDELLSDKNLIDESEALVVMNWDKIERKLLEENRSVSELLGQETTDRILKAVENVEGYDPGAVKAFLGSEAVNKLLAQVLYDGIYNFFQTIDVFGNIIGGLPIIGPIRNQIRDEAKKNLDRTVGPLIQSFLRSYTKIAVIEVSDFVLSPRNQKIFGGANVKLVSSIISRPVNSLVPPSDMTVKLRKDLFDYVRTVDSSDVEDYVTLCYDILGDKSVDDLGNINRVIDSSPTLQKTIDRFWSEMNESV